MKLNLDSNIKIPLILHLADSALIIAQRLTEWCGHGPILEQDIAITNISLDVLGQARNFYQYAATLIGNNCTEDSLAYFRNEREFKNFILVEQPNENWGQTILKIYLFSAFQFLYFQKLILSKDEQLSAIAEKAIKETTYHLRWSKEWVIRLGDGTIESKNKMENAIENLWKYCNEFFINADFEIKNYENEVGVNTGLLKEEWLQNVLETFSEATLPNNLTLNNNWLALNGKQGIHSEHLGFILTELQYLQKTYPNCEW